MRLECPAAISIVSQPQMNGGVLLNGAKYLLRKTFYMKQEAQCILLHGLYDR